MYKQNRTLKRLAIIALILTLSAIFAAHAAAETTVYADAPEYVLSDTFDVKIMIEDVDELDTGEFHLLFDPNVVDVTDVTAGDIGNMNVGFTNKRSDKIQSIGIIKVIFDISGTSGVSGSGSLATVSFDVIGTDGACSVLNISNPNPQYNPIIGFDEGELWDGSAEEITAKWENDIVCIGDSSLLEAKVTIFVENHDDDDLFVKLFIDGDFKKQDEIKKNNNETYYEGLILPEGLHTFKIEWYDHDTNKEYVKTEEHNVSGTTAVTLMTDKHTEDDNKISAHVHVKNLDDDDLDEVYLYIDGVYWKYKSISSGSVGDYGEYEFEGDEETLHSFKIEWFDPGTGEDYEKIIRSYITGEEAVTLYVDRHTEDDDKLSAIVGDVNNDNRITAADSVLALQMSVGSIAPDLESADVSGDGRISSLDALMILMMAQKTQVYVNAPEVVSGAFNATIDIYNVVDLDSGQFDLSFDPSVVNVTAVCDGNIDGTTVPTSDWRFMDAGTIRVLFDLSGADTVSGAGSLATISFEITGAVKDESVLDISNGELFDLDTYSEGIPAIWNDCEVTLGVPVTVNAPEIVSGTFNATIDIADVTDLTAGQFDLSFDPSVVKVIGIDSGSIGGTEVHIDMWRLMDDGRVRVLFRCPGATVVSGSGSLATIHFEVTGAAGDASVLDISDGQLFGLLLVDYTNLTPVEIHEIPATWNDCEVTIGVPVTVNAPEIVSGTFNATIDIRNVTDLDSGQFDLSFDSSVVNVTAVCDGNIGGTTMPISDWRFMDADTIRVLFDLPDADLVSGSGSLATIDFEITGAAGDRSALDISNGGLFDLDTYSEGIPATWTDYDVTV
jgi:hypothetical protein